MLKIRLSRTGKKRQPSYRVVVADVESPRDGRYVEQIGFYDPMKDPIQYRVKEDRALHWLSVGAQPTDAVRRLLDKQGTFGRLTRLHAGEQAEALVAEYEGVPWPPIVEEPEPEIVEEPEPEVVDNSEPEVIEAVAAPVVEEISETVEPVVEAIAQVEPVEETPAQVEPVEIVAEEVTEEVAVVDSEIKPEKLTKVEGIGPKTEHYLNEAGITTFDQLSTTSVNRIKEILSAAGNPYNSMVPDTWPAQAMLAAEGDWDELKALQDKLDGGRIVNKD